MADITVLMGGTLPVTMKFRYVEIEPGVYALLHAAELTQGGAALSETNPVPVAGKTAQVSATPTITAGAYAAGDLVGTKMSFSSAVRSAGGGGMLHTVVIADKGKQDAVLDLVLFDSDPSSTTFTDNDPFDVADDDLTKIIGAVQVLTYTDFADNSVAVEPAAGVVFKLASGTTLYGALVARTTPTYTSTSDLTVRLGILQNE